MGEWREIGNGCLRARKRAIRQPVIPWRGCEGIGGGEIGCSASREGKLVILDEVHRTPNIFQVLRGVIDQRRRKGTKFGQFFMLGSASIDLLQQSAETLAGRVTYLELTPFCAAEVVKNGTSEADRLWVRGGFPDSFLASSETASFEWRRAFIQTYLERGIPMLGSRIPADTLESLFADAVARAGPTLSGCPAGLWPGVSGAWEKEG